MNDDSNLTVKDFLDMWNEAMYGPLSFSLWLRSPAKRS
jgi:hypothetical protein